MTEGAPGIESRRTSDEKRQAILDALPMAVGLVKEHNVLWVNKAFTALLGYSREEAIEQPSTTYFQDLAQYHLAMKDAASVIAQGGIYQTELLLRRKSGEVFWGSIAGQRLAPGDTDSELLWQLVDTTERRATERALHMGEERLVAAQAHAAVGSWEYGPELDARYWSRQMFTLFQRALGSGVPTLEEFLDVVHPDDRDLVRMSSAVAFERHGAYKFMFRSNPTMGDVRHFEVIAIPEFDEQNRPWRLCGTTQDVTEREESARALRESELRLQRLLENSNDLTVVLAADGQRLSLWGPLKGMLGYELKEVSELSDEALAHPDDFPRLQGAIAQAIAQPGIPVRIEYRCRHEDGSWVDLEAVGTSWLGEPTIRGIVVNLRCVTERKRGESERLRLLEQLQHATKMEAVGRLAGGIAHDFNNLLTVIGGNIELARQELNQGDPLDAYLADVTSAADSASSLTRQLLAFSRRQLIEPRVVSLNELIENLQKMLERLIGEDIALETHLEMGLGAVRIDPGQFDQVIVNLAVNARHAMPKGGRLTIETANLELDGLYCNLHSELIPGRYIQLSVTDTGEGMSREVMTHAFEPFYTTKPTGVGTGLGLSVIFGVVKQAGGTIEVYSELGIGTTFKIYLPRVDAPAQDLARDAPDTQILRGSETILLVEDHDSVREMTAAMLRRLGYQLLVFSSGIDALASITASRRSIDLLLTDLVMPKMSGRDLGDRIREILPRTPILYCSGYTEDAFVRHSLAAEQLHFIGKPFTLRQLGLKVRQVLEDGRNAREE